MPDTVSTTPIVVIVIYLALLLGLGLFSSKFFRGTSKDYFVASHSIGPFLLLMSVFGTTMTAFALVGSTGKAFERGIGVYGLMASISGLVHAAVFFLIGIRLWVYGKRYGFVTQIQFFRARFESSGLGYLLFPILVGLVIPYLLIGVIGACFTIRGISKGMFTETFVTAGPWLGSVPPWLTGLVICLVVLIYVFAGGSRGTAWANTFQTLVFMVMGLVAFVLIANSLGGLKNAAKVPAMITADGRIVQNFKFDKEKGVVVPLATPKVVGQVGTLAKDGQLIPLPELAAKLAGRHPHLSRTVVPMVYKTKDRKTKTLINKSRKLGIPPWMFLTYFFIPLSVGMFPHLFQHWLTAKSARAFRLTVIAHPLCILLVWLPCVLIGVWASGLLMPGMIPGVVLGKMLGMLVGSPVLMGLLTAGVLAAIMSSMDSQFLCLGTMFTNDIVLHIWGKDRFSDKQIIWIARIFVIVIVALTYFLAMKALNPNIFDLAIWCFSGFSSLFPLVFAALYWKRVTLAGAYACILSSMGVWFYFFQASGFGGEYFIDDDIMPVTLSFGAGAIALVLVSLVTKPPSAETIKKFFPESAPLRSTTESESGSD